jgi:hypothetical protein
MENRIDYLMKDNHCEKALEQFKKLTSVLEWIDQYSNLFDSVSIKPKGLPRITSSHFDGERFENIQKFANLYETVQSLYE